MPLASMVLPIAPSTYHAHVAQRADPAQASPRARQDLMLMEQIRQVHAANVEVYGARKVWRQLGREGIAVARCTVERLMRRMGLRGVVRGKETRTTIADKALPCPADKVNRQFRAPQPNALPRAPWRPLLRSRIGHRPMGGGLHLRGDLAGLRVRRLRHRRLRPPHYRLAGVADSPCRLRP